MTWARFDDSALDHPKLERLSNGAFRLWWKSVVYCMRHLTDGFLPGTIARNLPLPKGSQPRMRLIRELTSPQMKGQAPLWERAKDGYRVHDLLEYNPPKIKVLEERQKNAARVKNWRERREPTVDPAGPDDRNGITNGVTNAVSNGSVTPPPSRPVPARPRSRSSKDRDHRSHEYCFRNVCVPTFLETQLLEGLEGDHVSRRVQLDALYKSVSEDWATKLITDDPVAFWRARFREKFGASSAGPAVPDADATQRYLDSMKSEVLS